ncbi:hypothetical protein P692DRAFT_201797392 [Suillus brevipes Sb2]|nr:hypothetical protein P692DRAFT_201797392 [Suillus brevipes Sb2]
MRLSSTTVLAAVAALASSISATPVDTVAQHCYDLCAHDWQCNTCGPDGGFCLSFLLGLGASCFCYGCWHSRFDARVTAVSKIKLKLGSRRPS